MYNLQNYHAVMFGVQKVVNDYWFEKTYIYRYLNYKFARISLSIMNFQGPFHGLVYTTRAPLTTTLRTAALDFAICRAIQDKLPHRPIHL